MNLQELMNLTSKKQQSENNIITEERILNQLDNIRLLISFYREYPDLFIDDIKGEDNNFKLYDYQRIILRIAMRHRYVYMTLPRGSSKSFLSMLILMLRCILYPGSEMFVTTGGKNKICLLLKKFNKIKTPELSWKAEMLIRTEGQKLVRGNAQRVNKYNLSTRPGHLTF